MNLGMGGYGAYVWTSFGLFVAMLVWDFLAPRIRLSRARRAVLARARREAARRAGAPEESP